MILLIALVVHNAIFPKGTVLNCQKHVSRPPFDTDRQGPPTYTAQPKGKIFDLKLLQLLNEWASELSQRMTSTQNQNRTKSPDYLHQVPVNIHSSWQHIKFIFYHVVGMPAVSQP